ncbi:S-adenosyl-L-methionine-dependent methyltransferase [Hyaloscypha variabilis F]|uniref:S-adenosyl-L-methionine-dependent methyltransferase n=1 Tax=Hyaloscypha variabilis (strain UAMH 11265 / GT02V1 / F) TaxID=1149755 RepID=A0A2J6QUR0_HYAVF|nr:S-adenosyl-L-methionine-dependent methyltransferase [Hyaloscypha variabilis F]
MAGNSEETPPTAPSATEGVAPPAAAAVATAETTQTAGQHVDVDQGDDDNDSALGDGDAYSATTSLASNIRNHTYENGRRYHSYQVGVYFAPNDEAENDRLDMHHHLATLILEGNLTTAPIGKSPQRILDVGCGTGIWSIDAGDEWPSAQVIGVDLSPTQPNSVPPNVQFEIDDVEKEWTFQNPFDLVHVRFMAASLLDWPKLVSQCYKHTKPGGWVEFKDWDFILVSNDNSLPKDGYIYKYHQLLFSALDKIGRPCNPGPNLKKWVEDAGYKNVTERVYPVPIGRWPKDKELKEIGAWNFVVLEDGLEAICMRMFTGIYGWSVDEVQVFLAQVRGELKSIKSKKIHCQHT